MNDIQKYKNMKDAGNTAEEVYAQAVLDDLDQFATIRLLRVLFDLSLRDVKEIRHRFDDELLEDHERKIADSIDILPEFNE